MVMERVVGLVSSFRLGSDAALAGWWRSWTTVGSQIWGSFLSGPSWWPSSLESVLIIDLVFSLLSIHLFLHLLYSENYINIEFFSNLSFIKKNQPKPL
jgi:hypothetical protein